MARLTHGASRAQRKGVLPEAVRAELEAIRAGVVADQGGDAELSTLRAELVDRVVSTIGVCKLLERDLAERGPFTPRGRVRSVYTAWLQAVDRLDRLSSRLGLDRRAARVPTLSSYLAERKERTP